VLAIKVQSCWQLYTPAKFAFQEYPVPQFRHLGCAGFNPEFQSQELQRGSMLEQGEQVIVAGFK
jgi:hypothetical protein